MFACRFGVVFPSSLTTLSSAEVMFCTKSKPLVYYCKSAMLQSSLWLFIMCIIQHSLMCQINVYAKITAELAQEPCDKSKVAFLCPFPKNCK